MIIVCQNCSSRLQLDDTKLSARPLSIRCPKCHTAIEPNPASPAFEKSALAVGGSPATGNHRSERPVPAPLFQGETNGFENPPVTEKDMLTELLATLVAQNGGPVPESRNVRPSWNPRKALVCMNPANRETIARQLTESGYQVFIADDTRQAVERMREDQLDVVLLDPQFDAVDQGAAFVMREVNVLRPAQRRRLFFTLLSPSLRTMDAHAAFLNNVNAVVNLNDLPELPRILEQALREYNELYKDLNAVMKLPAL
jgi:predicted Zn finger-like uncharacterized protein